MRLRHSTCHASPESIEFGRSVWRLIIYCGISGSPIISTVFCISGIPVAIFIIHFFHHSFLSSRNVFFVFMVLLITVIIIWKLLRLIDHRHCYMKASQTYYFSQAFQALFRIGISDLLRHLSPIAASLSHCGISGSSSTHSRAVGNSSSAKCPSCLMCSWSLLRVGKFK